ncbi:MAG: glycosyltransferase family 2 protein, partial [Pseudomonadota bacterium]
MVASDPHIAILLATYNGARFLERQLDSLAKQSYKNWSLWISDDGSKDETLQIIDDWHARHPDVTLHMRRGPGRGAAQNFVSLLLDPDIKADFYSFSDQDDVWFEDKLSRALASVVDLSRPALYGARTVVTDTHLQRIAPSLLEGKELGFHNALVQNFAAGNTMVFNAAARDLVPDQAAQHDIVATDWLMYMLVSGAGGDVIFDREPCLFYRQHGDNQIGYNADWVAMLRRVRALLNGRFSEWSAANLQVLSNARLKPDNAKILEAFVEARQANGMTAVTLLKQSG